jgi:hypothetical protein
VEQGEDPENGSVMGFAIFKFKVFNWRVLETSGNMSLL